MTNHTPETTRSQTSVDTIESTWSELERSHEYGALTPEGDQLYSDNRLEQLAIEWELEKDNPFRSFRSQEAINIIIRRILFEMKYREEALINLESTYSERSS